MHFPPRTKLIFVLGVAAFATTAVLVVANIASAGSAWTGITDVQVDGGTGHWATPSPSAGVSIGATQRLSPSPTPPSTGRPVTGKPATAPSSDPAPSASGTPAPKQSPSPGDTPSSSPDPVTTPSSEASPSPSDSVGP